MPIRTRTPIAGDYTITRDFELEGVDGVLAPASLSDLFEVYGAPTIVGPLEHRSDWAIVAGEVHHFSVFVAQDPGEQAAVDAWAVQIDTDDPDTIRAKVDAEAVLDEARVDRDGGERRIFAMKAARKRP